MKSLQVSLLAAVIVGVGLLATRADNATAPESPTTFRCSSLADSAVLLDAVTGRSWILRESVTSELPSVWIPIERLDDPEKVEAHLRQEDGYVRINAAQLREYLRAERSKENPDETLIEIFNRRLAQLMTRSLEL